MKISVQLVLLLLCLIAIGTGVSVLLLQPSPGRIEVALPTATPRPDLKVFINGAVNRPGVYSVQQGDRLEDVLAMAGGLTTDADPQRVNPSLSADDETHFYIPRIGELVDTAEATVNINTASADELQALPGIGPSRADDIIEHRTREGPFSRGEDLLLVSGFGPKTVDGLLDLVTVK
ncbi:MAG: helix-hairpin-helix domain-containing protein [Chloroflexota bacterium]|nr:helix-hairpin-helix domain-containing protein [Chloroflexota bacterium]MDE2941680.1 helix-hairpin-helix domain-containing protein [Chloroflexota bacterium]MDE3267131.1 helix-hairpin-helix domain-containing protein [Chloroflexota bacterium]